MSRLAILAGHEYDVVSPAELEEHYQRVSKKIESVTMEAVSGVKPLRVTSGIQTATGTFIALTLTTAPKSGYVWSVMRVSIGSNYLIPGPILFRTASPQDITLTANLAPDQPSLAKVVYALAAGSPHQTFSKGQLILGAGEYLVAGMFDGALTGHSFSLNVEVIEVPAEMVGKLLM